MESEVIEGSVLSARPIFEPLQTLDEWLQQEASRIDAGALRVQAQNETKQKQFQSFSKDEANATTENQLTQIGTSQQVTTSPNTGLHVTDQPSFDTFHGGDFTSSENHIGRLQEYRQANPGESGPVFTEMGHAQRFTCKVKIGECEESFGDSPPKFFSNKKAAKQYACQLAIEWLIQNSFMPAVGAKFPKPRATQSPTTTNLTVDSPALGSTSPTSSGGPTAASRVPDLCHSLGLPTPSYVLESNPEFPSIYSGYAHFSGDPRVSGKLGEFTNIFGRKNAKEACAIEVVGFLESMRDQRAALDDVERERVAALLQK